MVVKKVREFSTREESENSREPKYSYSGKPWARPDPCLCTHTSPVTYRCLPLTNKRGGRRLDYNIALRFSSVSAPVDLPLSASLSAF